MRVLIVGCGYVGLPLGAALARAGHAVFGVRRSPDAATELVAAGIQPVAADLTRPAELAGLPGPFDWVVNCASAGGGGAEAYRQVYVAGNRNLLAALAGTPVKKYVYTSSTGVYGQNDGPVVTEADPAEPANETGRVLVEAESVCRSAAAAGFPAVVLRVAGIYGPGRGHYLKQFLAGEARLEGAGGRWLNLIHQRDVAGAIAAALRQARPGEIYNAVDDEPVTQAELFAWLAAALGRPVPPSVPEMPDAARRRGVTSKRVSNRKLKAELGYAFEFPSFRQGFAAELKRWADAGELRFGAGAA